MKLLIIKPSSLGDIVHTFPAAAEIQAALPEAELSWVANDSLAEIVRLYPGVKVIPFPRKALGKCSFSALRAFLREMRSEKFDAVIDFQGLLRSGIIARCARTGQRWGFANAREGAPLFYGHAVKLPPELRHAADKNRFLAREFIKSVGATPAEGAPPEARLVLPDTWLEEASALAARCGLDGDRAPILAVGSSSRWESKSWQPEYFGAVINETTAQIPNLRVWLLGGKDERDRAEAVRCSCGNAAVHNLAGETSLGALAGLLARSQALLTNDSGPMHIAAALGVPCVAFFGATDDTLTGPYGPEGRHCVIHSGCAQSPCFQRICPRHADCSAGIPPALAAAELVRRLLPGR